MPRHYCDYCDIYIVHDHRRGRKQHNYGWKHREAVKAFWQFYVDRPNNLHHRSLHNAPGVPKHVTEKVIQAEQERFNRLQFENVNLGSGKGVGAGIFNSGKVLCNEATRQLIQGPKFEGTSLNPQIMDFVIPEKFNRPASSMYSRTGLEAPRIIAQNLPRGDLPPTLGQGSPTKMSHTVYSNTLPVNQTFPPQAPLQRLPPPQ